jgi:hypothetical protein
VERGEGRKGETVGVIKPMYNISLFGIFTMNPPCAMNISQYKWEKIKQKITSAVRIWKKRIPCTLLVGM